MSNNHFLDKHLTIAGIDFKIPEKEQHVRSIYISVVDINKTHHNSEFNFIIPNIIINDHIKLFKNNIPSAITTITISDQNVVNFLLQLDEHIKQQAFVEFNKKKMNIPLENVTQNMKSGIKLVDIGLGNKVIKLTVKLVHDHNTNSKYNNKFIIHNELNLLDNYGIDEIENSFTQFTNKVISLELISKFWFNHDNNSYGYTIYVQKIKLPF